jgi:hypothetical protein
MSELVETNEHALLWVEVLDQLEAEIREAEALASKGPSGSASAWQPPGDMPELPDFLVDRIRKLLAQQSTLLERLFALRRATRQQIDFVNSSAVQGMGDGPRFIDHRS